MFIQDGTSNVTGSSFIVATGGTETTSETIKFILLHQMQILLYCMQVSSSGSNTVFIW